VIRLLGSVLLLAACDAGATPSSSPRPPPSAPVLAPARGPLPAAPAPSPPAPSQSASPPIPPSASADPDRRPASWPPGVERLAVPNDLPASIVWARDGRPPTIVFLPGVCSNAGAYLWGFAETARAHGGVIAMDGDRPCGGSRDFRSISSDPAHEEPRLLAALAAAGLPKERAPEVILIGYSLGATLIENLVRTAPERWRRAILIGSPRDPRLDRLGRAAAIATMSCSLDVPHRMKGATKRLEGAGVPSAYFEMPGCTHGNLAEGDRVFDEALRWIEARPIAPR
jgi:alpha-beta hydrolase superfamily lysophospholipase